MTREYRKQLYELPVAFPNTCGWKERHLTAMTSPREGFEKALTELFSGWLRYADTVREVYGGKIGEDGVLGPEWATIGAALRGLLNGEIGRLDGGTLDALVAHTLQSQGFNLDELSCNSNTKV